MTSATTPHVATPAIATRPAAATVTAVEVEIMRQVAARAAPASICPSEVARAMAPGDDGQWRGKLSAVRRAAIRLAQAGRIDILRKGRAVDPHADVRGVIRLRAKPGDPT
jgi:hypothetical protein